MGDHLVDAPTCRVDTPVDEVDRAVSDTDLGFAVVVAEGDIVLGRITVEAVSGAVSEAASGTLAGDVMREGPTTVRPATELEAMLHRMEHAGVGSVLVTRSDGRLLGVLRSS